MTGPTLNRQGITHQQRRRLALDTRSSKTLSELARDALGALSNPTASAEPIMAYARFQLEKGLLDSAGYHNYVSKHARSLRDRQYAYPTQVIEEDVV